MYVCMGFDGVYNYPGLVRQVSGFITVSVSALGTCRNLDPTRLKGGRKPRLRARETTALRRDLTHIRHSLSRSCSGVIC